MDGVDGGNDLVIEVATRLEQLDQVRDLVMDSVRRDQGYGYRPEWHWDLDRIVEIYVDNPRNRMLLARSKEVSVGCCGIRVGTPAGPREVVSMLPPRAHVAQIVRLVVTPGWRRRGLGRRLVEESLRHVSADPGFTTAYLHTNALVPGVLQFWQKCGARVLTSFPDPVDAMNEKLRTVHMTLPLREGDVHL
ncbi:Acetyltransferase (GNAT) family [Dermatophilus congolensis]|uniref:Acetyltransferase (GNAT) family n=1 Tax=Dermatophilus congolensis TaxID=1863 RepID=A0AA46BPT8_9MICO|nr:Acetyltransferase (GNAT) family [Dermatophilus congolensis]